MFHGGYPIIRWSAIFVLYLKRNEQIVINNINKKTFYLFLKHLKCKLIHVTSSSSRLFNKLSKLALAISNFLHKHKLHFFVPQIYGCAFIAINQSIVNDENYKHPLKASAW